MRIQLSKREGFTLFELLTVIFILLVLIAIAVPNYLNVRERAYKANVYQDLYYVSTCLEIFRADWGKYPVSTVEAPFGKHVDANALKSIIAIELTGTGQGEGYLNTPSHQTSKGEKGGMAYASISAMKSLCNPFDKSQDYYYKSNADGSRWIIYVSLPSGKYFYTTSLQSTIIESDALPEP